MEEQNINYSTSDTEIIPVAVKIRSKWGRTEKILTTYSGARICYVQTHLCHLCEHIHWIV
jgi:hypothetical protein